MVLIMRDRRCNMVVASACTSLAYHTSRDVGYDHDNHDQDHLISFIHTFIVWGNNLIWEYWPLSIELECKLPYLHCNKISEESLAADRWYTLPPPGPRWGWYQLGESPPWCLHINYTSPPSLPRSPQITSLFSEWPLLTSIGGNYSS